MVVESFEVEEWAHLRGRKREVRRGREGEGEREGFCVRREREDRGDRREMDT